MPDKINKAIENTKYRRVAISVFDNGYVLSFGDYVGNPTIYSGHKVAKSLQEIKELLDKNFVPLN